MTARAWASKPGNTASGPARKEKFPAPEAEGLIREALAVKSIPSLPLVGLIIRWKKEGFLAAD
jgi:hypothetical protein